MGVPRTYRQSGEAPLVTFSAIDIATGLARTNLYAGVASGGATTDEGGGGIIKASGPLSNIPFFSSRISVIMGPNENATLLFDMDFKLNQRIEGQSIVQIPYVFDANDTLNTADINIVYEKIDISGSVSIIASGAAKTIKGDNVSSGGVRSTLIDIPRTTIKSGEKLRLRIYTDHTIGRSLFIGTDPLNRAELQDKTRAIPSQLIAQVPFKVDI